MSRPTSDFNAYRPPTSTTHLSKPSSLLLPPDNTTNKLQAGIDRSTGKGDSDSDNDNDLHKIQRKLPSPSTTGDKDSLNNTAATLITPPTSSTKNNATTETLLRNLLDTTSTRLDNNIVSLLSSEGKVKE
jgi:hypothetical protein